MSKIVALPLLVLSLIVADANVGLAQDDVDDNAAKKLQGRWEITGGFNQGRELTEPEVAGTYVTVTANKIVTFDRNQQQTYQAIFRIDEDEDPIEITMTSVPVNPPANELKTEDQVINAVAQGILKFDGKSKWTLCYALPETDRPKKFQSPEGSKIMLFTLERKQVGQIPAVSSPEPAE